MNLCPTKLQRASDDRLQIQWSDGHWREYTVRELRNSCTCATCNENRQKPAEPSALFAVLSPEEAQPLRITSMKPVGNYAYTIGFTDGHDTGIYTFETLLRVGREIDPP